MYIKLHIYPTQNNGVKFTLSQQLLITPFLESVSILTHYRTKLGMEARWAIRFIFGVKPIKPLRVHKASLSQVKTG